MSEVEDHEADPGAYLYWDRLLSSWVWGSCMGKRRSKWDRRRKQLNTQRNRRYKHIVKQENNSGEHIPFIAYCSAHDKKLLTRKNARRMVRVMHEPGMREFPCDVYPGQNWWHAGHMPENVRMGYVGIAEVYGR